MRQPERDDIQDWLNARMEAYIDGDLSDDEHARFEQAQVAGEATRHVEMARRIHEELRALPAPVLRTEVSRLVLSRARAESETGVVAWLGRLAAAMRAPTLRPVLSMAVLVALVLGSVLAGRPEGRESGSSPVEVQRALAQARWALAYVSHVGKETGSSVRDEVLQPHVVRPMQRALGTVLEEQHKTIIR